VRSLPALFDEERASAEDYDVGETMGVGDGQDGVWSPESIPRVVATMQVSKSCQGAELPSNRAGERVRTLATRG
jgi:hypothetical protein